MAPQDKILQIVYDERTRAARDPAFEELDNLSNPRPDWFEYWPIRQFLDGATLAADAYYGFLSPKFWFKTKLSGERVRRFILASEGADVVTFSPNPEATGLFLNPFEQGEFSHPGLLKAADAFLRAYGIPISAGEFVMDTEHTVYSNYFAAKRDFWVQWARVLEFCMRHAEDPASSLHGMLTAPTAHDGRIGPQMKIFIMERMASVLLATNPGFKVVNFPPYEIPVSEERWANFGQQIVALEALKRAYRQTRNLQYIHTFRALQSSVFEQAAERQRAAQSWERSATAL
jgi:hypothetical protein